MEPRTIKEGKMLKDRFVFMDGQFVRWEEANVHIMSHSFARGSGIFEVLGVHKTGSGTAVFRLDEYVSRFFRSAGLLEMNLTLSAEQLHDAVLETVRRNGLGNGVVKIMGFYPQVAFDIMPPSGPLSVAVFAVDPVEDLGSSPFLFKGVTACIPSWRKIHPGTVPPEAKVAANYLNGMMARMEARKKGFDMAIMLDNEGFVAEGGTESVFIVKNDKLYTPALGKILKSISRKTVPVVAASEGIETVETQLRPEALHEADEVFFSCTVMKVWPVKSVDDKVFDPVPGTMCRRLNDLMNRVTTGEDERFKQWLFPV
jgi:branched-chain amino acid aminotransferase